MALIKFTRLCFPIGLALVLLVISSIPMHIAGASAFFPMVDVMVIYYWSSYRPQSMPDWFVFTLGILRDVLEGLTIGVSPCIYLLVRFLVTASKDLYKKQTFIIVWQGFAVVSLIAITGKWLLVSFILDKPLVFNSAIMQFVLSIAIYPIFHWLFSLVNLTMPEHYQDA